MIYHDHLQEVSICQADLGLAELRHLRRIYGFAYVSICQADLGLAEPGLRHYQRGRPQARFNLPGRFGFGRTEETYQRVREVIVSICQADLGLAEPNVAFRTCCAERAVSICQADLGLAEPH